MKKIFIILFMLVSVHLFISAGVSSSGNQDNSLSKAASIDVISNNKNQDKKFSEAET